MTAGFDYAPPSQTKVVALALLRVADSGGATVSPVRLHDGCGMWQTFVGGGEKAFL
jgi:hypothetical protein